MELAQERNAENAAALKTAAHLSWDMEAVQLQLTRAQLRKVLFIIEHQACIPPNH